MSSAVSFIPQIMLRGFFLFIGYEELLYKELKLLIPGSSNFQLSV